MSFKPQYQQIKSRDQSSLLPILLKRKRSESSGIAGAETLINGDEDELDMKIKIVLKHPKYQPLNKFTPENQKSNAQFETSISESTPMKQEAAFVEDQELEQESKGFNLIL